MNKTLSEREIENREIEKIVKKLVKMEKKYSQERLRFACSRYATRTGEQNRLEREIQEKEETLANLKKTVKK